MAEPSRWIEFSEGDEFAGYRIEQRLGRGGMGILYLAIEPGLERRVALKLIAPEVAAEEIFARRFAEESRIAASIEHPNVVPIYAAGEEDGVPYIAMRYVPGADLGKRIGRDGRLGISTATALIAQVGNGLDAIHAAGLVHRDVKPANVLLAGEEGSEHAYLTDFGVARNVATESGLTQTGRFVGTLDYVAPEQISGGAIDARVDVYALGCLLFKLLTGEVPFPRDGEAARLYAHLNDPPPAPSLYVPEISMALDDVVIRAMSKAPEDRFLSAGDLGRAALAAVKGERPLVPERTVATGAAATRESPVSTPAAAPTAETRRVEATQGTLGSTSIRERRGRLAIGGGLIAVAAIVVAVVAFGSGGDSDPGTQASGSSVSGGKAKGSSQGTAVSTEAKPKKKKEPEPLSKTELVERADAVCASSQGSYREIRNLEREYSADVPYAQALVEFARTRIRGLRQLTPPPSLAEPYEEYLKAQERVYDTDVEALEAARNGNVAGVEAARDRRDAEDALREGLARQIGFSVCSTQQS